ncbi:hypothetical protein [Solibacillus sp. FSL K6-1523]|uniref:hypothetical protein n=1 Tax=Solibacillus sp. FSL K6-1523 TaxID=2921471 RepID=UPI0030FC0E71
MTQYTVLVADKPLNEADYTGFDYISVRELKKLYPISDDFPEQAWHSMEDDVEILNAPDEDAFAKLNIFHWENPSYDLALYSEKPYVYGVEGRWEGEFLENLLTYIREQLTPDQNAELLQFWAGEDKPPKLTKQTIAINEIQHTDLQNFAQKQFAHVQFV